MSYDITTRILNARAAADTRARHEQADQERGDFLLALHRSNLAITDWEAAFLVRFLNDPKSAPVRFTDKQREAVDQMRAKYQGRIQKTESRIQKADSRFRTPHSALRTSPRSALRTSSRSAHRSVAGPGESKVDATVSHNLPGAASPLAPALSAAPESGAPL